MLRGALQIRVKALKEFRARRRTGITRKEQSKLRLPEKIVSPEEFVGSFAGDDCFKMVFSGKTGEKIHRSRGSPEDRTFGMADDVRKNFGYFFPRHGIFFMTAVQRRCHEVLVRGLVKSVVFKADGKCPELSRTGLSPQKRHHGTIEASREVTSHGDIGLCHAKFGGPAYFFMKYT